MEMFSWSRCLTVIFTGLSHRLKVFDDSLLSFCAKVFT